MLVQRFVPSDTRSAATKIVPISLRFSARAGQQLNGEPGHTWIQGERATAATDMI
jgi:hypothetical protein